MAQTRPHPLLACLGLLVAAACSESRASLPTDEPLYHDYGTVDLGTSKTHDFDIPVPTLGETVIVESATADCDCAVALLLLQNPGESTSTPVYGLPQDLRVVQKGGKVTLRLTLKTDRKEAADIARSQAWAHVNYKLITGKYQRFETVHVRFHYGIRTPIKVAPVAHIDFGEVPMSSDPVEHVLALTSNIPGQTITWGEPVTQPECIAASLVPGPDGSHRLHVKITPFRSDKTAPRIHGFVAVETGLQNYPYLKIPVTGQFIGDIQFEPSYYMSFNIFPFDTEREDFVNIIDHNRSRPKDLVVLGWHDDQGTDITDTFGKHFEVALQDLSGRKTRVRVKYLGTMGGKEMRGWLWLGKQEGGEPVAKLSLIGHNKTKS